MASLARFCYILGASLVMAALGAAGLLDLQCFYLENPKLASLFSFQDGNGNLLKAFVVMAVSFALGFLLTWFNTANPKVWENFSVYHEEV